MTFKVVDDFKMLRALYDFTATLSQTLSFAKDELFIFHSSNNIKKNWWSVVNNNGKLGYIPSNYVTILQVTREEYLAFIIVLIDKLSKEIARDDGKSDKNLELMQELLSKKQSLDVFSKQKSFRNQMKTSKDLPPISNANESQENNAASVNSQDLRLAPSECESSTNSLANVSSIESSSLLETMALQATDLQPVCSDSVANLVDYNPIEEVPNISFEEIKSPVKETRPSGDNCFSPDAVYSLVQQVREATGLSFFLSKIAVGVVCDTLSQCHEVKDLMQSVVNALRTPIIQPVHRLENTTDALDLRKALSHLATCHDDAQQRSWQLWDDEHTISSNIELAVNVLNNADPEISKLVLKSDKYEKINILLEYYQMEERWTIRNLLVDAFTSMSSLDNTVISVLLNSVLPMEIAREMEANMKNNKRITKLAQLLTIIFSTGEPMPITHIEHLGTDFVKIVLNLIENEEDSETADIMLTLLLAYNLQFKPGSSTNIVVQTLNLTENVKIFTEKLLLLINREEDPVQCLKLSPCPYHAVLKLFMDIFSGETAAKLFYTNDIRVLVDIISRQLTDLPSHNEKRTAYLCLCKLVLISCESICYDHRLSQLSNILVHILTEEIPPSENDRKIVREILSALPGIFGFTFDDFSG